MIVGVRRFALLLLAGILPVVVGPSSPAVADHSASGPIASLPLAVAAAPPYFPVVRVDTITLPKVSEQTIGVPDTADLYAPYLPKGLRAKYKDQLPVVVVFQGASVD